MRYTCAFVRGVVELVYFCKKNEPCDPCSCGIKRRLDPALGSVVCFDARFELLGNSAPDGVDCKGSNVRDEIDKNSNVPRDKDVGSGPKEPGRDGIGHIGAVLCTVGIEIVDANNDGNSDKETSGNSRSNESGKEKYDNSGINEQMESWDANAYLVHPQPVRTFLRWPVVSSNFASSSRRSSSSLQLYSSSMSSSTSLAKLGAVLMDE